MVKQRRELPLAPVLTGYLAEPLLQFCTGREADPKTGITIHGPYSLSQPNRHPRLARVGFLGSAESTADAKAWIQSCSRGVSGEGKHPDFPGTSAEIGFFFDLAFDASWDALVTRHERASVCGTRRKKDRFQAVLELFDEKLSWLAGQDRAPDYVIVAFPDDLLSACAVADYQERGRPIHRDLRRAIKSVAMQRRLATQLLKPSTVRGVGRVDHKSKCAWNFFTGMYFKLGAIPWAPVGLDPAICFVGISFFHPLGSPDKVRASLAQAFNGRGDAMVIRGEEFPWDPSAQGRSPHLDSVMAERLIKLVLERYHTETQGERPKRVVIHKTSRFWPAELEGFAAALRDVPRYDLLAVADSDGTRLLREGNYPVLRGTHFSVGDVSYLYSTGFIPSLGRFPHGHVPLPLQIADHQGGDTPVPDLLHEILILSKMNWNSSNFCSRPPVTLSSSRIVGDILREIPPDREALPNLKYYV